MSISLTQQFTPLSSKTAVFFHGIGDSIRGGVVDRGFLRHTNMGVAANSERFVITRDEELLRSVVKKGKLDQWQSGRRFKVNAPDPYSRRPSETEE